MGGERMIVQGFVERVAPDLVPSGGFATDGAAFDGLVAILRSPKANPQLKQLVGEALNDIRGRRFERGFGILQDAAGIPRVLPPPPIPRAGDAAIPAPAPAPSIAIPGAAKPEPVPVVAAAVAAQVGQALPRTQPGPGLFHALARWLPTIVTAPVLSWKEGDEIDRATILAVLGEAMAGTVLIADDVRPLVAVVHGMMQGGLLGAAQSTVEAAIEVAKARTAPVPESEPLQSASEPATIPAGGA